jgi:GT2 family glycosyltransferase
MLSIVIVGWNCGEDLLGCLTSIARHPPSTGCEIIYVDNASTDGTVARLRERFPEVRVRVNACNAGFQRANNQGMQLATGSELLLLNPDTEVLPGALDTLVRFLREHPQVGAASARCVYPDGRLQWAMAPFPTLAVLRHWFWTEHPTAAHLLGRVPSRAAAQDPSTQEQEYAYGACFALKREVLDAVGPMDEGFFLTGGEVAWSQEIRRRGWKVFYVAEATIIHRASVARRRRAWVSELDWVSAHRRLLYRYEGLAAGMAGDVMLSAHLVLFAARRAVDRLAGSAGRTRSTRGSPA